MDAARRFEHRLLAISVASGLLFLLVLGAFSFLIFRSLSSRFIESVLEESRADAESIARKLASPSAPLRVIERTKETELYLHSVLQEKRTVEYITVTDREGRRLYEGRAEGRRAFFDAHPTPSLDLPDGTGRRSTESSRDYDIAVPIENIGFVHVGVSKDAVEARLKSLRSDLITKTAVCGFIALAALAATDVFLWRLLERNRKLERARADDRRFRELGEVAAGLAHEVRNPLHSIGLSLQNLQDRFPGESERFDLTRSEVKRLDRLVGDFLAYARPSPLRLDDLGLASYLKEICELASFESKGRGVDVRCDVIPDATVRWDGGKIRQVIWNLVRNAVDASAESAAAPVRKEVRLDVSRDAGFVEIRVSDRGEGIPEEVLRKIPSLFFTTKKGGSGLGLMVASRIVQEHGGSMSLSSRAGEGTCATVRLPERVPEGAA
ncbi:MAG: ATP-binding protein [Thermoanaerobaculia bacterium]